LNNLPQPTVCHHCGHVAAVCVCPLCGTERPAYTALKNMTAKQPKPAFNALDMYRRYCEEAI
jgi:hypothetical protein